LIAGSSNPATSTAKPCSGGIYAAVFALEAIGRPLWQLAKPAGVGDVDDDQRAAVVEVEQAELGGWGGTRGSLCGSAARS
jgi:hypothetical protein